MSFYEKGAVRIHYEEAGSGFPLLIIPGGGLNSTIAGLKGTNSPFNPIEEFKGECRCIFADGRGRRRTSARKNCWIWCNSASAWSISRMNFPAANGSA